MSYSHDIVDGNAGFGDVGTEYDLPCALGRLLEHLPLLSGLQGRVQHAQHVFAGAHAGLVCDHVPQANDVLVPRQEHQDRTCTT